MFNLIKKIMSKTNKDVEVKKVKIVFKKCPNCNGTGLVEREPGENKQCPVCLGNKKIKINKK